MIILLAIGLIVCGILIGWHLREWYAQRQLWEIIKRHMIQSAIEAREKKEAEELDRRKVMHITVTQHDGVYFVYEKGTNRFLAQGKTHKELADALNDRFENTRFMASPENLEENGYDE